MKLDDRRGKVMLFIAWISSCLCSTPQAIIFHVESHPNITQYEQCVTYNFFENEFHETVYSFIGMILMYALPLIIIIFCYASIYIELYKKSKKCVNGEWKSTFCAYVCALIIFTLEFWMKCKAYFQSASDVRMMMFWEELSVKRLEWQ